MTLTPTFKNTDWRKQASAAKLDKEQIEKVFGDQAYSFISAKAGPLMDPEHLLGFEVIHHNEDNTRLVGIYAFRVSEILYYAPVFFLNGQIKGDHFLYNTKTKLFKALTEARATKEIGQASSESGEPQDRSDTDRTRFGVNLTQIMYPPHQLKRSFFQFNGLAPALAIEKTFCPSEGTKLAAEGLLGKFIQKAGIKCASVLHETMLGHLEFTNTLMGVYGDEFDANVFPEMPTVKSASAPVPPLTFTIGMIKAAGSGFERDTFLKYGFSVLEQRENPEVKSDVYQITDALETVQPGNVYELPVVSKDAQQEGIIGTSETLRDFNQVSDYRETAVVPLGSPGPRDRMPASHVCIYFKGSKALARNLDSSKVAGKPVISLTSDNSQDIGTATPKAGKMYAIYDTVGKSFADEIVFVGGKKKSPIIGELLVLHPVDNWGVSPSAKQVLMHPEVDDSDFKMGVLGTGVRFLEIDSEEIPTNGSIYPSPVNEIDSEKLPRRRPVAAPSVLPAYLAADAFIGHGIFGMVSSYSGGSYDFDFGHGKMKRASTALEATKFLTAGLGLDAQAAIEMIDAIREEPGRNWRYYVEPGAKIASAVMRLTSSPNLMEKGYDGHFNVQTDNPVNYSVQTQTYVPEPRLMKLNEAAAPNASGSNADYIDPAMVVMMSPDQIKQTMKSKNLPFAFEHGIIGGLVDTFDAGHMLDEYMPALETGNDRLGRLLFLFYWKPQDYEKLYGADELLQRENELLSGFLSLDKLILNLQKKPKKQQSDSGSSALT